MKKSKKNWKLIVGSLSLAGLLVLAIVFLVLTPKKITKKRLESEEFKKELINRIKRFTNLELTYTSIQADKNLYFTMNKVILKSKEKFGPKCTTDKIIGKVANSYKYVDIEFLEIKNPNCNVSLSGEDNSIIAGNVYYKSSWKDISVIFGLSLKNVQLKNLDLNINKVFLDTGKISDTYMVKNLNINMDLVLSALKQKITGKIGSSQKQLDLIYSRNNKDNVLLTLKGDMAFSLSALGKNSFSLNTLITHQELNPQFDLHSNPLLVAGKLTWNNIDNIKVSDLKINAGETLTFNGSGTLGYFKKQNKIKYKLQNIEIIGREGIASLLNLEDIAINKFEVSKLNINGHSKLVRENDEFLNLDFSFPKMFIDAGEYGSTDLLTSKGHIKLLDVNRSTSFKLDYSGDILQNNQQKILIERIKAGSTGFLDSTGQVNIKSLNLSSDDRRFESHFIGHAVISNTNPQVTGNLEIIQDLKLFHLGDIKIDGTAKMNVALSEIDRNEQKAVGVLSVNILKSTHETFILKNTQLNAKFEIATNKFIDPYFVNFDFDELQNKYFDFLSAVDFKLEAKIGSLLYQESKEQKHGYLYIPNARFNASYLIGRVEKYPKISGNIDFDQFSAPGWDGLKVDDFKFKNNISWNYIPHQKKIGLSMTSNFPVSQNKSIKTNADLSIDNNDLIVDYSLNGDLTEFLKESTIFSYNFKSSHTSLLGKIRVNNLFNDMDLKNRNMRPLNVPYEGEITGSLSGSIKNFTLENISSKEISSLTGDILSFETVHSGLVSEQSLTGQFRAVNMKATNFDDNKYYNLNNITGNITTQLDLPLPMKNFELSIDSKVDRIKENGKESSWQNPQRIMIKATLSDDNKGIIVTDFEKADHTKTNYGDLQ